MQEKISNETKLCDKTKEEIQIVKEENDSLRLRIGELEPKFKNYWHTIRESDLFRYLY